MKDLFSPFIKLAAIAACALTLGSCGRAEYAMLPKGGSYHGVTRAATPVPAAPAAAMPTAATATPETMVATAPTVASTPEKVTAAPTKPAAKAAVVAAEPIATSNLGTAATVTAPAPKLTLTQRLAMSKLTRKMDKLAAKVPMLKQHNDVAETARIDGNLRTGLIFLLVGLLISLFSGISGIFGIIGAIFAIIGLVFIILWLLDQA